MIVVIFGVVEELGLMLTGLLEFILLNYTKMNSRIKLLSINLCM
jgi:hypothetical protein